MAEKRIEKRHRKRLPVKFGTGDLSRVGFTEDISEEGFFLKASIVFPPKTVLRVELAASENETILVDGTVMWAKKVPPAMIRKIKGGMGVKILRFHSGEDLFRRICAELDARC